jgi:hypothetical protein
MAPRQAAKMLSISAGSTKVSKATLARSTLTGSRRTPAVHPTLCRTSGPTSATDGAVIRISQSVIERQISATCRLAITSAALRREGVLVNDPDEALELAIHLCEERTPGSTNDLHP